MRSHAACDEAPGARGPGGRRRGGRARRSTGDRARGLLVPHLVLARRRLLRAGGRAVPGRLLRRHRGGLRGNARRHRLARGPGDRAGPGTPGGAAADARAGPALDRAGHRPRDAGRGPRAPGQGGPRRPRDRRGRGRRGPPVRRRQLRPRRQLVLRPSLVRRSVRLRRDPACPAPGPDGPRLRPAAGVGARGDRVVRDRRRGGPFTIVSRVELRRPG